MKRGWRRPAALFLAALLAAAPLGGCSPREEELPEDSPKAQERILKNDGEPTHLVLAEISQGEGRTQALREIADKYQADFPQTEIEIVTVGSGKEAQALLEAGEADLVELSQEEQAACVGQGLLADLTPWLEEWEERSTLTTAAKGAMASCGGEERYLLPATLDQDVFYYRSDWLLAYNEGKDLEDQVFHHVWSYLPSTSEALGTASLAFAGEEGLVSLFDNLLWSAAGLGAMTDAAGAYFCAYEGHETLFTLEQAELAMEQLEALVETAPQGVLSWTEDQAVEAFAKGEAFALVAGWDRQEEISAALEEDAYTVTGLPIGSAGVSITAVDFTGFGLAAGAENLGNGAHFLCYLSNGDNNTHLAQACGTVPIHTTAWDLEPALREGALAIYQTLARRTDLYGYAQLPRMYEAAGGYASCADGALRSFLRGETSQKQALGDLDAFWRQALEEEGPFWDTGDQKA